MARSDTCYMCNLSTTSREHAPPQCFFPEEKTFGRDLRQNLITVPSCDTHNSKKSKDDEFFRAVILLATAQGSDASKHQFFQKLLVASRRMPHAHALFVEDSGSVSDGKGKALRIDRQRFDACIDHLARALFFEAYHQKWLLPLIIFSPDLFSSVKGDQPVAHEPTLQATEVFREFLKHESIRGENPEVFRYRLKYDEGAASFAFVGQFFELFEVFAYSSATLILQAQ